MASSDVKALRKKIKGSKRYLKLREILEDNEIEQYNIPVETYLSEAKQRFFARKFRKLDANSVRILDELTAAGMEDSALRSRLTEMLVLCEQAKKSIGGLLDRYENAALIEHGTSLRRIVTTKEERKEFIRGILEDYISYLRDVETFSEQLKLLITDIDKAGYQMKNIIDAQRLVYRPELAGRP